jgi:nitroreductase
VTQTSNTAPDLAERAGYLIELAARAPSVHNTQPWRFTVTGQAIELYAGRRRLAAFDFVRDEREALTEAAIS